VLNGGPAEAAGVAPGDVAVALDGVALTPGSFEQRLRSYRDREKLALVVFRGEDLITTTIKLSVAPEDTCYLSIDPDADAAMNQLRQQWLQTA
jgi:predicted metalloprotease with PDZ domain